MHLSVVSPLSLLSEVFLLLYVHLWCVYLSGLDEKYNEKLLSEPECSVGLVGEIVAV